MNEQDTADRIARLENHFETLLSWSEDQAKDQRARLAEADRHAILATRHLFQRVDQFLDNASEAMRTHYADFERLITEARDEIDEHLNPR